MVMIRNTLFGISLLALSGTSVFAAPAVKHSTRVVAQADAPAPAGDKAAPAAKKEKKHTKPVKKDAAKTEGGKEMKAAPEKAAPEKAAK
jgi:hypothetical protein